MNCPECGEPEFIHKQNRDLVVSGKHTFKIKSRDGKPVINKTAWTKTILDIRTENADVTAWARAVLEEAETIAI